MRSIPRSMLRRSASPFPIPDPSFPVPRSPFPKYFAYGTAECMYLPQNSLCHQSFVSVFSRNGAVM